jgi:hypothetical protein
VSAVIGYIVIGTWCAAGRKFGCRVDIVVMQRSLSIANSGPPE